MKALYRRFCRLARRWTLLFALPFLAVLLAETPAARAQGGGFTVTLPYDATTSAGIFKSDGTLVRTLWSNVRYPAGARSFSWDGKDDTGATAPAGTYEARVVYHNVRYYWEGVIGNSSKAYTNVNANFYKWNTNDAALNMYYNGAPLLPGANIHRAYLETHALAVSPSNANLGFIAAGYNEGQNGTFTFNPNDPQARQPLGRPDVYRSFSHVATDGERVYYANTGSGITLNSQENFILAFRVSDGQSHLFAYGSEADPGTDRSWPSVINRVSVPSDRRFDSMEIYGVAVQRNGNYLFASHKRADRVRVFHKVSGQFLFEFNARQPAGIAATPAGDVWVITENGTKVVRYTNLGGTPTAAVTLTGFSNALAVAVNPVDGTLAVADGGGSQQVKAYNNNGAPLWTLGVAGGYNAANGPAVRNDKFWFFYRDGELTCLAFGPDGSLWVGDPGNQRLVQFNSDRTHRNTVMFLRSSYLSTSDANDPRRVFSNWLEFEVDYSKPLSPNNGSWRLVRNWSAGMPRDFTWDTYRDRYAEAPGISYAFTLSNGRTYGFVKDNSIARYPSQMYAVVELPATGPLRLTGARFPEGTSMYPDGSVRYATAGAAGGTQRVYRKHLTGFDASGNPQWAANWTEIASAYSASSDDPFYAYNFSMVAPNFPTTEGGIVVFYNGSRTKGGMHLGGVKTGDNKWLWKSSPAGSFKLVNDPINGTAWSPILEPRDGTFNTANYGSDGYAGNLVMVNGRNIIYGYHGEYWNGGGQPNQYMHWHENGLFIGQFGTPTYPPINHNHPLWGSAGNSYCPSLVSVGNKLYLYHNDEGGHGGVHRWRIEGADQVQVATVALSGSVTNQPPAVALTSPLHGAAFTAPASLTLAANATDSDGVIAKVEFFNGASLLGEDTTTPFSLAWNNVPAGTYTLTARATDNSGATATSAAVTITVTNAPAGTTNAALPWLNGRLLASTDGRSLRHENGQPFFWLGDTAWQMFQYPTRAEAEQYLENRRQKGFNVVQSALLMFGGSEDLGPNGMGNRPLLNKNPATPDVRAGADNDFWDDVDWMINKAAEKGIYVALLPAWGAKYLQPDLGALIFDTNKARLYGEFLGDRYKNSPNVIWMLGGDVDGDRLGTDVLWRALANGIRSRDTNHLMTYHPSLGNSSGRWFHDDAWLGFNVVQSGHYNRDSSFHYWTIQTDYGRTPPRPTLNSEPCYEDHRVTGDGDPSAYFTDYDARQAAYWSVLAGAAGHTYGHDLVWNFYVAGRSTILAPYRNGTMYWPEAMDRPGAFQMTHLRKLFLSRPIASRVPDQTIIAGDPGVGADHLQAARGDGYALVYSPNGKPFTVNLGKISGSTVTAWWFDPRNGTAASFGQYANSGTRLFTPPGTPARGNDWVLVLDDTSRNYTAPGSVNLGGNNPPAAALTAPASGAAFAAGANLTLTATASDSDGTITKVEFYQGTTLLGEDTTSPYSLVWSAVPAGSYTLTARAVDNGGASTVSAAVSITVTGPSNAPPAVALTSPANLASFTAPATIALTASASDSDGSIARVEFYSGSQLLNQDTTSPYSFTWSGVAAGTYYLTARAFDNAGASNTSATVTVTVGTTPGTVTVNWADTRQEIDGFGAAFPASAMWIRGFNEPARSQILDLLFSPTNGMGLSIVRTEIISGNQDATIGTDPTFHTGVSGARTLQPNINTHQPSEGTWNWTGDEAQVWLMQRAKAYGVSKMMATVWSAPAWMKANGSYRGDTQNGQQAVVLTNKYQAFADYLSRYVREYKTRFGLDIHAVSFANEPDFPAWYQGGIWNGAQMRDFVKNALGPTFARDGVSAKVMLPENSYWGMDRANEVLADPVAANYTQIIAHHGYDFQYTYFSSAKSAGKRVWQTEVSDLAGNDKTIADGIKWAYHIHRHMTEAEANAWVWWWAAYPGEIGQALLFLTYSSPYFVAQKDTFRYPKRVPAIANYSRFIRPGYVRLNAPANPLNGVYTSAYKDPASGQFVFVAINDNSTAQTLNVSVPGATGLTALTPFVTSATQSVELQPDIPVTSGAFVAQLPPKSITTFVRSALAPPPPVGDVWVSDLEWVSMSNGTLDPVQKDRTSAGEFWYGSPISLKGTNYAKGLGFTAPSTVIYNLEGRCSTFTADLGLTKGGGANDITFEVWADGEKLYDSGVMRSTDPVKRCTVNVAGRRTLKLVATTAGSYHVDDQGVWAGARLTYGGGLSVALTAPANNSSFLLGTNITLAASAATATGAVTKVEFYVGGTKLGEDATSPYTFSWNNAALGTHAISARAYDTLGNVATSAVATVSVVLPPNQPPTVSLTSPAANARFASVPATISLSAAAADSDGAVAKVEFFQGSTKVGEATTAPYSFTWSNVPQGIYTLTARATDNQGATTTSGEVMVTVGNAVPVFFRGINFYGNSVTIDGNRWLSHAEAVAAGLTFSVPQMYGFQTGLVPVPAVDSDTAAMMNTVMWASGQNYAVNQPVPNGTYHVYFWMFESYQDGFHVFDVKLEGQTVASSVGAGLAKGNWVKYGPFQVTVTDGSLTMDIVRILNDGVIFGMALYQVGSPNVVPTVSLTSPAANSTVAAGTNVSMTATAVDTDGTIARVEFYQGANKLGEDTTAPFSFVWKNVPPGDYVLSAVAYDDAGAAALSAPVPIRSVAPGIVAPTVQPSGNFVMFLPGVIGRTNTIQASPDLQNWVTLTNLVNTGGTLVFTDPQAAGMSQRFYRVWVEGFYASNVVGFARILVPTGHSIVAVQFNAPDRRIGSIFGNVPGGTRVSKFRPATADFGVNIFDPDFLAWLDPNQTFKAGDAAFFENPSASPYTWTQVGDVPQGLISVPLVSGYQMTASVVPQAGRLQTDLGFPPSGGELIYLYRNGRYQISQYDPDFASWLPAEPVVNLGEGFFVFRQSNATWTRSFSVTP